MLVAILFLWCLCLGVPAGAAEAVPMGQNGRGPALDLAAAYDCGEKSCKAMSSCAEACYKLTVCGQRKRDRDGDGIPCENLCSAPCK